MRDVYFLSYTWLISSITLQPQALTSHYMFYIIYNKESGLLQSLTFCYIWKKGSPFLAACHIIPED